MTFTRLQIGEPRLKGTPRGGSPCVEPYNTGQVNNDTGFETHSFVGGSNGEHFSTYAVTGGVAPTAERYDGSHDSRPGTTTSWVVTTLNTQPLPLLPQISTTNPRSGSRHVRIAADPADAGDVDNWMVAARFRECDGEGLGGQRGFYSARVNPGDLVEASGYFEGSQAGYEASVFVEYFTVAHASLGTAGDAFDSGLGTYAEIVSSSMAPGTAHYVLAYYGWTFHLGDGAGTGDIDDCTLTIS